ncbi:VTT domain-containing protein [Rhizobium sp. NFR03]|uniref:DedA family protein n=1 Tax=Rhizobium sp. NFR03 TaxID=1566263 RepID=UPI0008B067CA|nr:VTT domain-containing protein [Rhizobium sp. NFR03]SES42984.1 membrane protein DedA, SNARE-associated domain [Rhizobium sp. NFR03]
MGIDPIGVVMRWISVYGLIGLFAAALAERFMPVIPSHGLLLSVGISASDGAWSLPAAVLATSIGSFCGCATCFYCVRALGDERSMRILSSVSRLLGISSDRINDRIASFRRRQTVLAFGLQLVPTIRLLAPIFAVFLRGNSRGFLTASAAGILTWSSLFAGIGFFASHKIEETNSTVLAVSVLGCVLLAEFAVLWVTRRIQAIRKVGNVSWRN